MTTDISPPASNAVTTYSHRLLVLFHHLRTRIAISRPSRTGGPCPGLTSGVKKTTAKRRSKSPLQGAAAARPKLTIRPARSADLAAIVALDAEITGVSKRDYWKGLIARTQRGRPAARFFLVAEGELGGERIVLGFIEGEIRAWEFGSAPCGWVYALSVSPRARLMGLGQTLLDALEAAFKRAGVTRMRTMVMRSNRLVMQFFRAAGMMAGPYLELEKGIE